MKTIKLKALVQLCHHVKKKKSTTAYILLFLTVLYIIIFLVMHLKTGFLPNKRQNVDAFNNLRTYLFYSKTKQLFKK